MVGAKPAQAVAQTPAVETVYLSLGANLGDCRRSLREAIARLADSLNISLDTNRDVARLFRTSPVGCEGGQAPYLNTVVRIRTPLAPRALLTLTQGIESELGRVRHGTTGARNQPRPIDIDILLYGHIAFAAHDLAIPHPRLTERRFVLEPLLDLSPDLVLPRLGVSVSDAAHACTLQHADQSISIAAKQGRAHGETS